MTGLGGSLARLAMLCVALQTSLLGVGAEATDRARPKPNLLLLFPDESIGVISIGTLSKLPSYC